jgi:G3E family GTPase|tara:strand:- start:1171 stop:2082 length:912 start_codon:yes stop_codon:yes gene_type:complete
MGIPLTLISGYLGTGKTTLINQLLRTTKKKIALLVNDFGDVNIDESLIESRTDSLLSIAGGCVCCSYGNELIETLESMNSSEIQPDHIVLEASGIALPSKIIQTVSLMNFLSFHGTVLLADASRIQAQLNDVYISDTIRLQIQEHDLLVLNKTDLIGEEDLSNCMDVLLKNFQIKKLLTTVNAHIEEKDMLLDFVPNEKHKGNEIKLEKKMGHGFISSTIKPTGTIDADALGTLFRNPTYNIERAKGFFKNKDGEACEIQYDGLTLKIEKTKIENDLVFVVIGRKNFYNEQEFIEKLNSIQTQ